MQNDWEFSSCDLVANSQLLRLFCCGSVIAPHFPSEIDPFAAGLAHDPLAFVSGELFRRQIESIREQTHENWVCVISDDASGDERLEAMREVLGGDPRFRLHASDEQRGVYRNFADFNERTHGAFGTDMAQGCAR